MGVPKKNKKARGSVHVSQRVRIRKKTEQSKDTLKKVEGRPPASVAPVFRVKIRKKQ